MDGVRPCASNSRLVSSGGEILAISRQYWTGSRFLRGVAGGAPLVVRQTAHGRSSIAGARAGLVLEAFYLGRSNVALAVPVQSNCHDHGSYVVDGAASRV